MDMNIQKYLSFVKAVEYGSFTKAAEMLHYSQSGVSCMIGDLEREWKVALLERGKGGVKLTSDGLTLLPYAKSVIAEYEKLQMQVDEINGLTPKVQFTTWDDYAVMSMVEKGLGVSILPQLILQRVPYRIAARELDVPAYRDIGLALRSKKTASLVVKRFMDHLEYRQNV